MMIGRYENENMLTCDKSGEGVSQMGIDDVCLAKFSHT